MDRTWDLTILYNGFEDESYERDVNELKVAIDEFCKLASLKDTLSPEKVLCEFICGYEKISTLLNKTAIYANLRTSANTQDSVAMSWLGRIMAMASETASASASLSKCIASYENLEELIESAGLTEYRYFLTNIRRDSKYLLSDKEEAVFSKMRISGSGAWSDLHSALTSGVKGEFRGEMLPLSSLRNLAYSPDASVRREGYEAEIKCYETVKEAVAFSLNSIKLEVINECRMRGYESPLHKTLYTSRMKKETLDALISAMEEYLPKFHRYLRIKAKALGHEGALPWYDLFAPMGKCDKTYTVEEAREYLLNIFGEFDSELCEMATRAFDERWIDFYPRSGKVGGAFNCGVPSAKVSRVLTNFDGSFSDIVTLAHELGHSFHDTRVFSHSVLNQDFSMPVAETASTFNEVLVMDKAIKRATDREEKLLLVESQLMDACQIICDIYSRYTFEKSVFENRAEQFLDSDKLCALMIDAQKKAYGDGLDEGCMHPYMWLCKGHYYSGGLSYYNFPYAFGGLFARGLYRKYENEGESFVALYKDLLHNTSVMDVEEVAMKAGIDLTDRAFWVSGLESIAEEIDLFASLLEQ